MKSLEEKIAELEELTNELREVGPIYGNYDFLAGKILGEKNTAKKTLEIIKDLQQQISVYEKVIEDARNGFKEIAALTRDNIGIQDYVMARLVRINLKQ